MFREHQFTENLTQREVHVIKICLSKQPFYLHNKYLPLLDYWLISNE